MKKTGLIWLLFVAVGAWAQQAEPATIASVPEAAATSGTVETSANFPVAQFATPTNADLYCAGFVSKDLLPNANYVAGGLQTPSTTKYANGDIIYLSGPGFQAGAEYAIVRELRDINEFEAYHGQRSLLKAMGQPYADLGRVKILDTRNKTAVARIEFSCDSILPGDTAIPFAEKPKINYRPPARFDRFAPSSGRLAGRIILAKDFDVILGTGAKVYMNIGSNQGVKVGDYFRAVRPYTADEHDPVDSISFKASIGEDTQKNRPSYGHHLFMKSSGPTIEVADLPRRAVGEIVVLGVTPTTATGMITFALEDVHIGDDVQLDSEAQ
jgi:hypothetical protein